MLQIINYEVYSSKYEIDKPNNNLLYQVNNLNCNMSKNL